MSESKQKVFWEGCEACPSPTDKRRIRDGTLVHCENCGHKIYRSPVRLESADHHFCDYECRGQWQSENQSGSHTRTKRQKLPTGYIALAPEALTGQRANMATQMASGRHRIAEHRLVMAMEVGRPLNSNEHVHHINGDKVDNRVENLVLCKVGEHSAIHMELRHRVQELEIENARLRNKLSEQEENDGQAS